MRRRAGCRRPGTASSFGGKGALRRTVSEVVTPNRPADPIDLLYTEIVADEKLKHGTKYERLAALVFKQLRESDTVTHDVRLRGEGRRTPIR